MTFALHPHSRDSTSGLTGLHPSQLPPWGLSPACPSPSPSIPSRDDTAQPHNLRRFQTHPVLVVDDLHQAAMFGLDRRGGDGFLRLGWFGCFFLQLLLWKEKEGRRRVSHSEGGSRPRPHETLCGAATEAETATAVPVSRHGQLRAAVTWKGEEGCRQQRSVGLPCPRAGGVVQSRRGPPAFSRPPGGAQG